MHAPSCQATNLVAGDTGKKKRHIFARDRLARQTTRVSVSSVGTQGDGDSVAPALSADGRFVAFESSATNLVPADTNKKKDIFVHDRLTAQTTRVSLGLADQADKDSRHPAISGDGRFVGFESAAKDLVEDDTNKKKDIFVHDRQTGAVTRMAGPDPGGEPNQHSTDPAFNADGSVLVFASKSTNLALPDTNRKMDVFVFVTGAGPPPNTPPVALDDTASTIDNRPVTVAVLANDTDADGDPLAVTGVTQGTNGTVTFTAANVTYTPAGSFEGQDAFGYTIADGHGGTASATVTVTVVRNRPPAVSAGVDATITLPAGATLDGTVSDDGLPNPPGTVTATWSRASGPGTVTFGNAAAIDTSASFSEAGTYVLRLTVSDSALSAFAEVTVTVNPVGGGGGGLPPDPITVAPPLDPGVASTIGKGTEFLYTGPNPIQTGVALGTIEAKRAAVLRGRVLNRGNAPLPAVKITVLHHPEFGQTLSRADGRLDLAVNGGSLLTVNYTRAGFLPAQRQINAPWQGYAILPDVVLIPLDGQVTAIDLNAALPIQVARGNPVTDADGTRQATVLFPQGTQAQMVMPDGSTQPLSTLSVRATEYTVGANGPNTMPGELPPSSGYTYAVELSVDEALAAGATSVRFNQPVPFYVQNFVGTPVGSQVPTGYYDRAKGMWVASNNGRAIRVISVTGGLADLDVDGDGTADGTTALAALGITDAERQRLASLYPPGQSLWRVLIPHFTPWDCNQPWGPDRDSEPPKPKPKGNNDRPNPKGGDPCKKGGSIIDCQTQTLGEVLAVTGTPFRLHYQSDRVPGRRDGYIIETGLTEATLPPGLQRVHVDVHVAGRNFKESFAPAPNLDHTFTWDGRDVYGRAPQGRQKATVRVGFEYLAQYYATMDTFEASFNRFASPPLVSGAGSGGGGGGGGAVSFSRLPARSTAPPIILWREYETSVGALNAHSQSLGGWTLNQHHVYDVSGKVLHLGDGGRRGTSATTAVSSLAGNAGTSSEDNIPAAQASVRPRDIAVGPSGVIYFADATARRIRRIQPDGVTSTVAGVAVLSSTGAAGLECGTPPCGDGGPATEARLNGPQGVDVAADGSVYFTDAGRVRRIAPDGIISTVAGNSVSACSGTCGDGGPATQAALNPGRVAVGPDGSIYVTDLSRLRRIAPDGIITTIAGNGSPCTASVLPCGDGGLATAGRLDANPAGLTVGPDGSIYLAERTTPRIRRVAPDGLITTVAGTGAVCASATSLCGDGGPATQAQLRSPVDVALGSGGNLYIADSAGFFGGAARVRRVSPDGIMSTFAGNGASSGAGGDGGFPMGAATPDMSSVAPGPDGTLLIAHSNGSGNGRIRAVASTLPGAQANDLSIAAEDGTAVYVFSGTGRHERTLDALTGATRLRFGYDSENRLTAITDGDGNVTTIERDGGGAPASIVSPGGQRTGLLVDSAGYLARVTNPANEAVQLTYETGLAEGLLRTLTDARSNEHRYAYDLRGRLVRDESPAGGITTLFRTDITDDHYTVALGTFAGVTTTYEVEDLGTGETRRVRVDPGGGRTESFIRTDGSRRLTYPDGTVTNVVQGPDPRFGMQAPIVTSLTVTTPAGAVGTRTASRTAIVSNPAHPLNLTSLTDTVTINGRTYTTTYNATTRRLTTNSPAARQSTVTLDALGRVVEQQGDTRVTGGLTAEASTYDSRGRLQRLQHGPQSWQYGYDAQDRLVSRTDAAGRSIAYTLDPAGRRTVVTLPSTRAYSFAYDANGNLTQVTMPDLGVHLLDYTPIDLESRHAPPGNPPYLTTYDVDGRVNQVFLPGGRTETFSYDGANRPTGITYPEAAVALSYADATNRVSHVTRTPGAGTAQELTFTYDGALVKSAAASGVATGQYAYTYDTSFRLKDTTLTSGADTVLTSLTRDNDGMLTGLGPFTLTRSGPAGSVGQIGDGALAVALAYDTLGRVTSRTHTVGGQARYALQLTFDTVGRISRKVETVSGSARTYDYAYDNDSQLTEVRRDGLATERYLYDANRNRVSRQLGSNSAVTATYDGQDRLLEQGGVSHEYDADGFLVERGADTFAYSTTGELLQATVSGQTVTYAYDGLRRRVSRTDLAGTTQYLYGNPDDDLQVTNTRAPGGVLTTYYYDDARRLFALQRGGVRYYVATDQLGSPRVVTDTAGNPVRIIEYDAFGVITADSNPGFDLPIRFAGGIADGTTGLVRFGFRDYDPIAGRWTARDPSGFNSDQANLYAYVNNNPTNVLDPLGLAAAGVSVCDAGFCFGFKWSYTPEGVSACFDTGVGSGSGIEIDPFADLDKSGVFLEAKLSFKAGVAKADVGGQLQIDECVRGKLKAEGCVTALCTKLFDDPKLKNKLSLDDKTNIKNPFKGAGVGFSAKAGTKVCQQVKW